MNNKELLNFLGNYSRLSKTNDRKEALRIALLETKIQKENSNNVLVYVGTYKVEKYINQAIEVLTYEDDPKAKYKRYIDIETEELYNVNMEEVEEFENNYGIVKRPVVMNNLMLHYQNYLKVKEEFFEGIAKESQEQVILKLINKD